MSNKLNYHIFKNSIRNGQYTVCKKIYNILANKNLSSDIKERFFISKLVFFEIQSYLKLNLVDVSSDEEFQKFKRVIKKVNNKAFFLSNYQKNSYKKLIFKILNEFYYCDCLIPNIDEYYNFELNLSGTNYKKNIPVITINNWWFQAIGHLFLFDTLLKGIELKLINIKKIFFNLDKEKISNKFFYKKFLNYTKKKKNFSEKKFK